MRVVKNGRMLEFWRDDGRVVKYDLAEQQCIGLRGKSVTSLDSQLDGWYAPQVFATFEDQRYADYLRWIWTYKCEHNTKKLSTVLRIAAKDKLHEQYFAAGITKFDPRFSVQITDIPKPLLRHARHGLTLTNKLLAAYKEDPDAMQTILSYHSIGEELSSYKEKMMAVFQGDHWRWNTSTWELIKDGTLRALDYITYIDRICTFEAQTAVSAAQYYVDYINMAKRVSVKFDRYPRNLLTTHDIMRRNYERARTQFDEAAFQKQRRPEYECRIGDYIFIYPQSTADIKDEAAQQHNCVVSYIQRVIDGKCHVMFMRRADEPDKSLVTLEIRNNHIVQALQTYNAPLTAQQAAIVEKWNQNMEEKVA